MTVIERNEAFVEELFQLVNFMGNEEELAKLLAEKLPQQHRTLQQNFLRLMKMVIEGYAKNNHGSDLRNEGGLKWAEQVSKIEGYLPFV